MTDEHKPPADAVALTEGLGLPPLPEAAAHLSGDFALTVIPHYTAQQMAEYAKAARVDLVAALQWYADGLHFDKASPDAWDTVSGEPQNWWFDEAGTATVEDGSIAAMTLRGELTAEQIQALD